MAVKTLLPMGPRSFAPFAVGFSKKLGPGNYITDVLPTAISLFRGDDPDASTRIYGSPEIHPDGQRLVVWQNRGVLGCVYKYEFAIRSNTGEEWPCTVLMPIDEI